MDLLIAHRVWLMGQDEQLLHPLPTMLGKWAERLEKASAGQPLDTLYAIDALAPGVWDEVGSDAAQRGIATDMPHTITRWLSPRHRPDNEVARALKTHLRDLLRSPEEITDATDEAVLAVGWSAGVLDDLLSLTALTDPDIVDAASNSPSVQRTRPSYR